MDHATDSASCSRLARPRRQVALDGVFQRNDDNGNDEQRRKPERETASKGQPRGRARRIGVTTTRPHCAKRPFGRVMRARAGRTSSWYPSRQLTPARGSRGTGTGQRPFMTRPCTRCDLRRLIDPPTVHHPPPHAVWRRAAGIRQCGAATRAARDLEPTRRVTDRPLPTVSGARPVAAGIHAKVSGPR